MFIPHEIKKLIGNRSYSLDDIGMSGSDVLCFYDMVLKIGEYNDSHDREVSMLKWMSNRSLPVPSVLYADVIDGKRCLLMSKIHGDMACSDFYLDNVNVLLDVLSCGMHRLWETDVSDCPFDSSLDRCLCAAEQNVENNLVDVNSHPDVFGAGGFKSPEHLLAWLYDNRPTEKSVLAHGDFCLPNIFAENGRFSGFIDLGDSGIADPYLDISLCYKSLQNNMNGTFGGRVRVGFDPMCLFDALGIVPEREKLRYYLLLDNLF